MLKITQGELGITQPKTGGGAESNENLAINDDYVIFGSVFGTNEIRINLNFDETNTDQVKLKYEIFTDLNDTTLNLNIQNTPATPAEIERGLFIIGFDSLSEQKQYGAIVDTERSSLSIGSITHNNGLFSVEHFKSVNIPTFDPDFNVGIFNVKLSVSDGIFSASLDSDFDSAAAIFVNHDFGYDLGLDNRPVVAGLDKLVARTIRDFSACGLTSIEENPNATEVTECDRVALNIREPLLGTVSLKPFVSESSKEVILSGNTQSFTLSGLIGAESGRVIDAARVTLDVFNDTAKRPELVGAAMVYNAEKTAYIAAIDSDSFINGFSYTVTISAQFGASKAQWRQSFRADSRLFNVSGTSGANLY